MSGKNSPASTGGFRLTLRRGLETHVRAKLFCDIGIEPVVVELTKAIDPDDPFRKQPDVFINDALNENASTLIRANAGTIVACRTGDLAGNMDKEIQVIGYRVTLASMHISMQEANIYLQATVKTADGLDMTGVIIEQHSPPMGEPFPVEKRITTNYHQSFVPPKSAFTMFPPSRRRQKAISGTVVPTEIIEAPKKSSDDLPDPLKDLRLELEDDGLLDSDAVVITVTPQPPTNLEGGEAMTTTNKPFPFEVFGEVDELDVEGRSFEMWVTKGDVSPSEPLTAMVEVRQPKDAKIPERHHKRFQPETEGGRWVVRRITIKATIPGIITVKSPAGLFKDFDVEIRDLGQPLEKTEVNFVRPEGLADATEASGAAVQTISDGTPHRPLPDVPTEESKPTSHRLGMPTGVQRIDVSDEGAAMPGPTTAAPASSDGFEDAPKTREMVNPSVSAALLDSLASQEELVRVPPEVVQALDQPVETHRVETPMITAKLEELKASKSVVASPPEPNSLQAFQEMPAPTRAWPESRRESVSLEIQTSTMRDPHSIPQPPAPPMPPVSPVAKMTEEKPKPALRMGPAPPPPPPAPVEPAMATPVDVPTTPAAIASRLDPLFEDVPQVVIPPEPPLKAPPIPLDAEEADEIEKKLEPATTSPPKKKMTLVEMATRTEPIPEPKPRPEQKPEQQPPSPPPGAKENPVAEQAKSGNNLVALLLAIIVVMLAGGGIGAYALLKDKDGGKDADKGTSKGHAPATDAGPHFGDARDDQAYTVDRPPAKPCVVLLDMKTRSGIPLSDWNKSVEIVVHPVTERPMVIVQNIPGQTTDLYEARWNAKYELDCESLRPYYKPE